MVASIDFDLSADSLAFGCTLTQVTESGSIPTALASAGHIWRAASHGGMPILRPARPAGPSMPELFSQYMP